MTHDSFKAWNGSFGFKRWETRMLRFIIARCPSAFCLFSISKLYTLFFVSSTNRSYRTWRKKGKSLFHFHSVSFDHEMFFSGQDTSHKRRGRTVSRKDFVHEKVAEQCEIPDHLKILFVFFVDHKIPPTLYTNFSDKKGTSSKISHWVCTKYQINKYKSKKTFIFVRIDLRNLPCARLSESFETVSWSCG